MRKRVLSILLSGVYLFAILLVHLFMVGSTTQAAGPIKLKAVSFMPVTAFAVHSMRPFAEKVAAQSKGELLIEWLGGPEVVATAAQGQSLKRGTIDILISSGALTPMSNSMQVTEYTPAEERKSGAYEWLSGYFRKALNAYYIGKGLYGDEAFTYTNFPVKTPLDLAGHNIGAISYTINCIKAFGAAPVNVGKDEWFTSLQSGVVDGFTMPVTTAVSLRLEEVSKYLIDHGYMGGNQIVLLMNLDKWNSLPKHLQKLINEVAIEIESWVIDSVARQKEVAKEKMRKAGVKFITFSPEDAKKYRDTFYNACWQELKGLINAEEYTKARKFWSR